MVPLQLVTRMLYKAVYQNKRYHSKGKGKGGRRAAAEAAATATAKQKLPQQPYQQHQQQQQPATAAATARLESANRTGRQHACYTQRDMQSCCRFICISNLPYAEACSGLFLLVVGQVFAWNQLDNDYSDSFSWLVTSKASQDFSTIKTSFGCFQREGRQLVIEYTFARTSSQRRKSSACF